jgi:hypothetical protein
MSLTSAVRVAEGDVELMGRVVDLLYKYFSFDSADGGENHIINSSRIVFLSTIQT